MIPYFIMITSLPHEESMIDYPHVDNKMIETSEGVLTYIDTEGTGFPVVLVHGNSCSSKVFFKQIEVFKDRYRLIAVDLPGHGNSDRPKNPASAYTIPGYAKILDEVTLALGLDAFAVIGFSLGGNIALQWTEITDRILGVMMISSAPMKYSKEVLHAYPPYEGGYGDYPFPLTEPQARQYSSVCGFNVDDPAVYFMVEDAMKTDPSARATMVASVFAGKGTDETQIVSSLRIPLAVIAGKNDFVLGLDYIAKLPYRNLWKGRIHFLENAMHALPVHQAEELHPLIENFIRIARS